MLVWSRLASPTSPSSSSSICDDSTDSRLGYATRSNVIPLILWAIALEIENEEDLRSFASAHPRFWVSMNREELSFWRMRFEALFDKIDPFGNNDPFFINQSLRRTYQQRTKVLNQHTDFGSYRGLHLQTKEEVLTVLKDLIIGNYIPTIKRYLEAKLIVLTESNFTNGYSKNMQALTDYTKRENILRTIFHRTSPSSKRYFTIVVVLFHLSTFQRSYIPSHLYTAEYRTRYDNTVFQFKTSQLAVYACSDDQTLTLRNGDVNFIYLAHMTNFFKDHIGRASNGTLYESYRNLDQLEKPRGWQHSLQRGTRALGRHWKGTLAYVLPAELSTLRMDEVLRLNQGVYDRFTGDDNQQEFMDYHFKTITNDNDIFWPDMFDGIQGLYIVGFDTADTHGIDAPIHLLCTGPRSDGPAFEARGWIQSLPAQSNIEGWQRLAMVSFKRDDNGAADLSKIWAYEAIVLPGEQVMMGRWWDPSTGTNDGQYSGPFLWWNTDAAHPLGAATLTTTAGA
ncbi:Hypothetical protein D9617_21g096500 [Elsinoe fawcettii]|nr:Hypothetical protein D9617_21g096500 [Elsinoe fawcettii]